MVRKVENGDWVKVIKGEYEDSIGQIVGHTDTEVKVYCVGHFQVWMPYSYVEAIPGCEKANPFANIRISLTEEEYNKLIEDHDEYCDEGLCEKCYCSLGASINPKVDELCLYNFLEKRGE